ncbi:hypothetical protein PPERSA_11187 [Pseudocohnilembus persalinus]|uniref:Uncharacterized protein n=1 Tax=Pseudocohnilembus persalinus TaxID=266149 RepID=A0A0V0QZF3_PSEPJ|nr:hypothetical protein PPERSA_11187 [Pseudocohnilembus persalinus]|eukprot:KRX07638.1 hypothetical protein PPERSA_11187 [Pseudocohnilembus persalinus]
MSNSKPQFFNSQNTTNLQEEFFQRSQTSREFCSNQHSDLDYEYQQVKQLYKTIVNSKQKQQKQEQYGNKKKIKIKKIRIGNIDKYQENYKSLKNSVYDSGKRVFIPFIQERDGTGNLIKHKDYVINKYKGKDEKGKISQRLLNKNAQQQSIAISSQNKLEENLSPRFTSRYDFQNNILTNQKEQEIQKGKISDFNTILDDSSKSENEIQDKKNQQIISQQSQQSQVNKQRHSKSVSNMYINENLYKKNSNNNDNNNDIMNGLNNNGLNQKQQYKMEYNKKKSTQTNNINDTSEQDDSENNNNSVSQLDISGVDDIRQMKKEIDNQLKLEQFKQMQLQPSQRVSKQKVDLQYFIYIYKIHTKQVQKQYNFKILFQIQNKNQNTLNSILFFAAGNQDKADQQQRNSIIQLIGNTSYQKSHNFQRAKTRQSLKVLNQFMSASNLKIDNKSNINQVQNTNFVTQSQQVSPTRQNKNNDFNTNIQNENNKNSQFDRQNLKEEDFNQNFNNLGENNIGYNKFTTSYISQQRRVEMIQKQIQKQKEKKFKLMSVSSSQFFGNNSQQQNFQQYANDDISTATQSVYQTNQHNGNIIYNQSSSCFKSVGRDQLFKPKYGPPVGTFYQDQTKESIKNKGSILIKGKPVERSKKQPDLDFLDKDNMYKQIDKKRTQVVDLSKYQSRTQIFSLQSWAPNLYMYEREKYRQQLKELNEEEEIQELV